MLRAWCKRGQPSATADCNSPPIFFRRTSSLPVLAGNPRLPHTSMKRFLPCCLFALLLAVSQPVSFGQGTALFLKVTKAENADVQHQYKSSYSGNTTRYGDDTVTYEVELSNAGSTA